jgi:hypothetical protein
VKPSAGSKPAPTGTTLNALRNFEDGNIEQAARVANEI